MTSLYLLPQWLGQQSRETLADMPRVAGISHSCPGPLKLGAVMGLGERHTWFTQENAHAPVSGEVRQQLPCSSSTTSTACLPGATAESDSVTLSSNTSAPRMEAKEILYYIVSADAERKQQGAHKG